MKYHQQVLLKDGRTALLRNGTSADGEAVFEVFNQTNGETDYLLSYPDENSLTAAQESDFLQKKSESENEIEIIAIVEGKIVGMAGIEAVGSKDKIKHRAEFGISILREYWGLGIGKALLLACKQCAKQAGYTQLELNVVSANQTAIALYSKCGFVEYGRNPRGFRLRTGDYQELVYMRLAL